MFKSFSHCCHPWMAGTEHQGIIHPKLVQCWTSVCADAPTLNQHFYSCRLCHGGGGGAPPTRREASSVWRLNQRAVIVSRSTSLTEASIYAGEKKSPASLGMRSSRLGSDYVICRVHSRAVSLPDCLCHKDLSEYTCQRIPVVRWDIKENSVVSWIPHGVFSPGFLLRNIG